MIEVDPQPPVTHALDHFREALEEPIVAHALVVEGRQHQDPAAAELHGMRREAHRVGQRAAARTGHHARGVEPRPHQPVQKLDLLFGGK